MHKVLLPVSLSTTSALPDGSILLVLVIVVVVIATVAIVTTAVVDSEVVVAVEVVMVIIADNIPVTSQPSQ